MVRVMALCAWRRTIRLNKDSPRLGVCDGSAIVGDKGARKQGVTSFAAVIVMSQTVLYPAAPVI